MNVGGAGHCCGMIDFTGMNHAGVGGPDPSKVVKYIAEHCCQDVPGTQHSTGGTVLFTERRREGERKVYPGTSKLKAYIKKHKLGTFVSLAAAPNPVHMGRTMVKPSLWNPDWKAVAEWYGKRKFPKPAASTRRW